MNTLVDYGVLFDRTWDNGSLKVLLNGYLLEPVDETIGGKTNRKLVPLLVSIVGQKGECQSFVRRVARGYSMLYMKPGRSRIHKNFGHIATSMFRGETEEKDIGVSVETTKIEGTLWYQMVAYRNDLLETRTDDEVLRAYLIGADEDDADLGFPRLFKESSIPFLPEWLETLKAEIKKRPEWAAKLIGHQMTGYRIIIPRNDLFSLVQDLAKDGKLPLPEHVRAAS